MELLARPCLNWCVGLDAVGVAVSGALLGVLVLASLANRRVGAPAVAHTTGAGAKFAAFTGTVARPSRPLAAGVAAACAAGLALGDLPWLAVLHAHWIRAAVAAARSRRRGVVDTAAR
jgi:hypothetical protein